MKRLLVTFELWLIIAATAIGAAMAIFSVIHRVVQ